ncbi:MAG: sulfotransferase family 2 domain-containing protein [Pseudomonadota bacterium]
MKGFVKDLITGQPAYLSCSQPFNENLQCQHLTCGCRTNNFVWVSHKWKTIYLEIPKCACTTVKNSLGLRHNAETFLFAYYIKSRAYTCGETEALPVITPLGVEFDLTSSVRKIRACKQIVVDKLRRGELETTPQGRYGFSHFFGHSADLLARNPEYHVFCVIRDPIKRFMSALNMFYGASAPPGRRRQRTLHSGIAETNTENLADIVDDIFAFPNHHFNTVDSFIKGIDLARIEFVSANNVDAFLETKFGIQAVKHRNVAPSYSYRPSDLCGAQLERIRAYYEIDLIAYEALLQ